MIELPKDIADSAVWGILRECRWITGSHTTDGYNDAVAIPDAVWERTQIYDGEEPGWTYFTSAHKSRSATIRARLTTCEDEFGDTVLAAEWELLHISDHGIYQEYLGEKSGVVQARMPCSSITIKA